VGRVEMLHPCEVHHSAAKIMVCSGFC
jgi:hypothetical protein